MLCNELLKQQSQLWSANALQLRNFYILKQLCKGDKHLKPSEVGTEVTDQQLSVMSQIAIKHSNNCKKHSETESSSRSADDASV